jgi:single-strand DNA-binding protein
MAALNKVLLIGNLTRDPEVRYTSKGTAIAKFGLAMNRVWTSETGEKKEEVTFVDVDVFGRTAESVGQYMSKGSPIFIEGRLRLDQWNDKQTGDKRSRLGVVAERVQFLGSPKRGEAGDAPAAERPARPSAPAASSAAPVAGDEAPPPTAGETEGGEDLPF